MAIYNEILAGRFARAIQKVFSMKGEVPVKQLAGEVMPVLLVDGLMALEHRSLLSVYSFSYQHAIAAGGAGTFASVRIRNPAGSNRVMIFEKITVSDRQAAGNDFGVAGGPIPSTAAQDLVTIDTGNVAVRDGRLGPTSGSAVVSFGVPAAIVATRTFWRGQVPANAQADVIWTENQEIVIFPSDCLQLFCESANFAAGFSAAWRERTLEESELTL